MKKKTIHISKKYLLRAKRHWRPLSISVFLLLVSASATLVVLKTSLPVSAEVQSTTHAVHEPLVVRLNQKLADVDVKSVSLTPKVEGKWSYEPGILLSDDVVSFTPDTSFKTDTEYTVELKKIKRVFAGDASSERVSFRTEAAPRLISATDTSKKPLGADKPFSVTLSSANRNLRDLQLRTEPAIEVERTSRDDTTFEWTPKGTWPQGTTVQVEIIDKTKDESLHKSAINIAPEPTVATPVKSTYFTNKDVAEITFSQPIDKSGEPAIRFNLEGKGEWANEKVYRFTPKSVSPGATYSYVVEAGLRSVDGGVLLNAYQGTFQTTGPVSVVGTSPAGSQLRQAGQELSFRFDQAVDKASAEERFSVSHGQAGQKRWSGNTLIVPVTGLGFQQTVTAQVAAGVKNAEFGLPSVRPFALSFTTENRSLRLNVPFYRQQNSATCAVASLRMALAYRGTSTSEMDIVSRMGYQPRSIDKSTNPPTWDDPTEMFVGAVNGSIKNGTGAGPDAPPVANAARTYGRGAQAITGASAGWMAEQIYAGHPVVMFGAQSASSGLTSWQTPSGKTIVMNLTSHATLVTGVVGEPSRPIGFWVSDPLSGGSAYWSAAAVSANISRDPSAQAVVVY